MKKLFFVSALGVAGLMDATNGSIGLLKNNEQPKTWCGVAVTFYDNQGIPYDFKLYTSDKPTLESCQTYQSSVITSLKLQGYRVEPLKATNDTN